MKTVPLRWKKSSFTAQEADCVELAYSGAVRDSKNRTGPILAVSVPTLTGAAKAGLLDR